MATPFTVEHYSSLLGDPYFYEIFLRTLWISALTTLLCVLIGVPEAYILSRMGTPVALDIPDPDPHPAVDFGGGTRLRLEPVARRRRPGQPDPASLRRLADENALYAVRGGPCAGSRDVALHDHSGLDLAAETRCPPPSKPRCRWVPTSSR
jgi:hypothetical protein